MQWLDNSMSEMRQDVTTGEWVVIAPGRSKRPDAWKSNDISPPIVPSVDATCPFCAGNEDLLPGIVVETPSDDPPGWRTRVVPNKFPAFSPERSQNNRTQGIYSSAASNGHHEVIIETPRHNDDLTTMSSDEVAGVISTYRERFSALMSQAHVQHVILFRNHGRAAGASLRHPHSQVIALAAASPRDRLMDRWAHDHFQNTGLCISCKMLEFEQKETSRVVQENHAFWAIVPFAAASPFELWLVPKRHQASFTEIFPEEQTALAGMLSQLLKAYRTLLDDPPYSYVIESTLEDNLAAPHRHWRLRLVPTLVKRGGFELGTGLSINPSAPEDDAALLREHVRSSEKLVR